jgi:hypothetical protein
MIYLLICTPFWKLLETAEKLKLKLPIAINNTVTDGYFTKVWKSGARAFALQDDDFDWGDIKYFTAPYKSTLHSKFEQFFNKHDIEDTFSDKHRSMLTYEILNRTSYSDSNKPVVEFDANNITYHSETNVGIQRLLRKDIFHAAYPLHEEYDEYNAPNLVIKTTRQVTLERNYCDVIFY